MQMIADGYTALEATGEAAARERTIEDRIRRLKKMLNCKNTTHFVATLLRKGVIN